MKPRHAVPKQRPASPAPTRRTAATAAAASRGRFRRLLRTVGAGHAQSLLSSLGRIHRAPGAAALTAGVIGVAIGLMALLYTGIDNARTLTAGWDRQARISVFLDRSVTVEAAQTLAERVRGWSAVADVTLVPPDDALAELGRLTGFGDTLDTLEKNPLPTVLVVQAQASEAQAVQATALADRLRGLPESDLVQLDAQWLNRLDALLALAERLTWLLGGLLSLAVLLVVGNTVRLEIQNRREEIEIMRLVGATNAFVRRPFLYSGLWYGLLGSAIGTLLTAVSVGLLQAPARDLANLYQSDYTLQGLGTQGSLTVLAAGAMLGLIGAWWAVHRQLRAIPH